MKKILYVLGILCLLMSNITARSSSTKKGNYILNLTGRTIFLQFYAKNPITKKTFLMDTELVGPMLIVGKAPSNIVDTLSAKLTPKVVNMHPVTCYKVSVNAFKFNSSKLKDKSIQGCTIPTPGYALMPPDYKITLEGNQIIVTELDTSMGLPRGKNKTRQWPSVEELAIRKKPLAEQINLYEQANAKLKKEIASLTKKIQKMHDKYNNIKPGKLTKVNNRHKMIANKKELIKKNKSRIEKLQKKIDQDKAHAREQSKKSDQKESELSTENQSEDDQEDLDTEIDESSEIDETLTKATEKTLVSDNNKTTDKSIPTAPVEKATTTIVNPDQEKEEEE